VLHGEYVLNELLAGLHVLIVSDHADLTNLFGAIVMACGGKMTQVATVAEALEALRARPNVALIDVVFEDHTWAVPVEASKLRVPVVALTHRCADPYRVGGPASALAARTLHSTEIDVVCEAIHAATSEGP
jgi:DNA-binding response OmpR family regulator